MKKITIEQIKAIKDLIYSLNVPVQSFVAVEKMLGELPNVEQVEVTNETIDKNN